MPMLSSEAYLLRIGAHGAAMLSGEEVHLLRIGAHGAVMQSLCAYPCKPLALGCDRQTSSACMCFGEDMLPESRSIWAYAFSGTCSATAQQGPTHIERLHGDAGPQLPDCMVMPVLSFRAAWGCRSSASGLGFVTTPARRHLPYMTGA
eukprot:364978-Chlamydomonas_euryale.AAC.3